MERGTRRAIIDYVLANTKKAAFLKAVKNFNFTPLVEAHRDHLLKRYFGDDGVKYSDALRTLWDEHITADQIKGAKKAITDLKAIQKTGGSSKKLEAAEKEFSNNTGGLRELVDMYGRITGQDMSDDIDEKEDDLDPEDDSKDPGASTINQQPETGEDDIQDGPVKPTTNEDVANVTAGVPANQEPTEDVGKPGDGKLEEKAKEEGVTTNESAEAGIPASGPDSAKNAQTHIVAPTPGQAPKAPAKEPKDTDGNAKK